MIKTCAFFQKYCPANKFLFLFIVSLSSLQHFNNKLSMKFVCSLDQIMTTGDSSAKSRFHLTTENIIDECGQDSRIEEKHILVTGATSGIGLETGRALACAGAKVYLMGRDEVKLQSVVQNITSELHQKQSSGSVQGVICDLNSLASVKEFAQKFISENMPLNVLVLNAGMLSVSYARTVDGLEQLIGVNHIAHAYLTQLLMPNLIANAPSRIVIVSSEYHAGPPLNYQALNHLNSNENDAKKSWGIKSSYQQSKLANVLFARAIASRYKDKQITAYSLHPGVINTNLGGRIPFVRLFTLFYKKKSIAQGAATTVYCALKPDLEIETGRYFVDSTVTDMADKWSDEDLNTFWEWTEKVIRERTANL
jgi:retinol dehydrogenase-12